MRLLPGPSFSDVALEVRKVQMGCIDRVLRASQSTPRRTVVDGTWMSEVPDQLLRAELIVLVDHPYWLRTP